MFSKGNNSELSDSVVIGEVKTRACPSVKNAEMKIRENDPEKDVLNRSNRPKS